MIKVDSSVAIELLIGQRIDSIIIDFNKLLVSTPQAQVWLWDDGQDCCEDRYMTCDDDLDQYIGAIIQSIEVTEGPTEYNDDDASVHETMFLRLHTNNGTIVACTHNVHNGYYGGFELQAQTKES